MDRRSGQGKEARHAGPLPEAVTVQDVMAKISGMKSTPTEANHAFGAFEQLCNWAASQNMIVDNPLRYTKTPFKPKRGNDF
jgi:hypothetical protein